MGKTHPLGTWRKCPEGVEQFQCRVFVAAVVRFGWDLVLCQASKIVSMIRKKHNHKPQTNPWHHDEEPHNHQERPGRQTKQNNQLSLPHQDDCKTRMDIK